MARPRKKLTKEQAKEVETLAAFMNKGQIADYFGIGRDTFDAILERQQDVFLHYKKGKAKAIGTVAKSLIQNATSGNVTAQIFYLKTQAGWVEEKPEENKEEHQPLTINFNVSEPVEKESIKIKKHE